MPYVDQIVLALLAAGLLASIGYQWRRGLRGRELAVTVVAMFYGLVVVTMMGFHCVDVLYGLANHLPSMAGSPFAYNWRTYSLLMFGALLVWLGVGCLHAALRLGRGDTGARARFLRLALLVLVIVVPVIPFQAFFGLVISALTVLASAVVALGVRSAAPAPAVLAAPVPARD